MHITLVQLARPRIILDTEDTLDQAIAKLNKFRAPDQQITRVWYLDGTSINVLRPVCLPNTEITLYLYNPKNYQ